MRRQTVEKWIGLVLILGIGAIHLIAMPDQFDDAAYKGVLFLINGALAAAAATGIWRSQRWGWPLGLGLSAATAAGYVWSRTVGLPGLPVDPNVFEPLGVASVAGELAFVLLAAVVMLKRTASARVTQITRAA